ncbi:hypothetical protein D4764_22G0006680 [Xyrichtys novacula]|uniref:Uncharacterized protein n=1 Tax=Xyrichtys novacula TaxID=13765 RepID=A0AAV1G0F6_XYRNO|nr:hypothetical protein D4764_22G0006680 [Xyrichtys novacula]
MSTLQRSYKPRRILTTRMPSPSTIDYYFPPSPLTDVPDTPPSSPGIPDAPPASPWIPDAEVPDTPPSSPGIPDTPPASPWIPDAEVPDTPPNSPEPTSSELPDAPVDSSEVSDTPVGSAEPSSSQAASPAADRKDADEAGDRPDDQLTYYKSITIAVLHLLHKTIQQYQEEMCDGCRINHTSQRQHQCLEVTRDDFYQEKFFWLTNKLYTPNLIPAIQHYLCLQNINVDHMRIKNTVQSILFELESTSFIYRAFQAWVLEHEDEDRKIKMEELAKLTELWLKR